MLILYCEEYFYFPKIGNYIQFFAKVQPYQCSDGEMRVLIVWCYITQYCSVNERRDYCTVSTIFSTRCLLGKNFSEIFFAKAA